MKKKKDGVTRTIWSLNDPNRIFLDSLFRARLADLGMETQTAVRCKRKEKTTISYTD